MNQISGRIVSVFYRGWDKNFFIHELGHKESRRAGGVCLEINPFRLDFSMRLKSMAATYIIQVYNPVPIEHKTIQVNYCRHFYANFRNKLRTQQPHIMKNSEIPFEFFVQPALPIFATIVPTQDNNITFQQSLERKS